MADNGLSPEELAREAGELLPDREALSLIDGGGLLAAPGGGLADPMGLGGGEDVDAGDAMDDPTSVGGSDVDPSAGGATGGDTGSGASDLAGGLGDSAMDHSDDADGGASLTDQPRSETVTDSDSAEAVS
jgi:hypothetical protein